jgi:hypothetical protein
LKKKKAEKENSVPVFKVEDKPPTVLIPKEQPAVL